MWQSEEAMAAKTRQIGEDLEGPILALIRKFAGGNLDALVSYLSEHLAQRFIVGETVEILKDGKKL